MGVKVKFFDGKWGIKVNHKRQRVSKAIGTKEAATAVKAEVEKQLALGDLRVFEKGTPSAEGAEEPFRGYATRFLEQSEGNLKRTTFRSYRYNINLHLMPLLGDRPIGAINRADAKRTAAALQKGISPKTKQLNTVHAVKLACRVASAVITAATEEGLRNQKENPFFQMGKHTRAGDSAIKKKVRAMSREQTRTVLQTVAQGWPDYHAFYMTAFRTGMRLGELLALKWDVINFDERKIEVEETYTGGKFTSTKNKRRRSVDMSNQLAEELQSHLVAMKARALKSGQPLPDLLFADPAGVIWDADNLRKRIHGPIMKKAKLRFTLKEVRHTFATTLIFSFVNGKPVTLEDIRRLMGHSSIKITVDTYGHFIPSSDRSVVNCLDDVPAVPSEQEEAK
jgi:integrase